MENKNKNDPDYLSPCKRCGCKAVVVGEDGDNYCLYYWVECLNSHKSSWRNTRESAMALWNKENK